MPRIDKTIPQGDEWLLPRSDWCDVKTIQGCDLDVLHSPTMQRAQERVMETWRPRHNVALVSLCTATRPYSASRKWSTYIREFSAAADFIIASNGGVIPIQYENCFPYLNYDAHGQRKYDEEYIRIGSQRLGNFLIVHRYDYVVFNFRPTLRNVKIARKIAPWLKTNGYLKDYAITPDAALYRQAQKEGFARRGFAMYPELYPLILNGLRTVLNDFNSR